MFGTFEIFKQNTTTHYFFQKSGKFRNRSLYVGMKVRDNIRDLRIKQNNDGTVASIGFTFGPHHFLEVRHEGDSTNLVLGCTHHGFKIDASKVSSDLENLIWEVRDNKKFNSSCTD